MSLKCTICGEEYSYGRKIVLQCEHKHTQFGSIFENERTSHTWNCGRKLFDRYKTEVKTPEPNLLIVKNNNKAIIFE